MGGGAVGVFGAVWVVLRVEGTVRPCLGRCGCVGVWVVAGERGE